MPRLLIVSRCSHPRGGADRIIADICRQLPVYGWDVRLGLTKGLRFNLPEVYQAEHPGLPVYEIDGTEGTSDSRVSAITSCIDATRPDILLTMRVYDAYPAVAAVRRAMPKAAPRFAVGIRAFEAPYLVDLKRNCGLVDGCITSGKLIALACQEIAGISQERVFSIGGGIAPPLKTPRRNSLRSPMRLLYAGRLEQTQKRVRDLVPFVNLLTSQTKEFVLTIAGDGPEEGELKEQLREYVANGLVRFIGWQDKKSLYETVYPEADLFLHFAQWEGVTIAPREAMAHGVVPVISRFTGLVTEGQFVDRVNSLLFPVGDVERAVQNVLELRNNQELYQSLSSMAADSQQGEYSAEGAICKWDRSLRSILASPKVEGHFRSPGKEVNRTGVSTLKSRITRWLRARLGRKLIHGDAGSEWPTSSGAMTTSELEQVAAFLQTTENHRHAGAGTA